MRRSKKKRDPLSLIILTVFIVLSSSHFVCRFDISGYIENCFEKAWAQPTASAVVAKPAAAAMPAEDALAPVFRTQTIARNPFLAPASIMGSASMPGNTGSGKVVYASHPVLRGIVNNGIKQLAIIEYNNSSNYYKNGQSFGDYTITAINSNSVDLSHPQNPIHLTLGRNN